MKQIKKTLLRSYGNGRKLRFDINMGSVGWANILAVADVLRFFRVILT